MVLATALLLAFAYNLFTTGSDANAQASPPATPTGLSAQSVAHDSVALTWDDPGDGSITGYQVLRRSVDGDEYGDGQGAPEFVPVTDDTASATTAYTDTSGTGRERSGLKATASARNVLPSSEVRQRRWTDKTNRREMGKCG